jgi:hypothetical protein
MLLPFPPDTPPHCITHIPQSTVARFWRSREGSEGMGSAEIVVMHEARRAVAMNMLREDMMVDQT